jgi:type II secretory ATPase GspE/PulE/Tfp pilus assembly ATPase PilB-like protein
MSTQRYPWKPKREYLFMLSCLKKKYGKPLDDAVAAFRRMRASDNRPVFEFIVEQGVAGYKELASSIYECFKDYLDDLYFVESLDQLEIKSDGVYHDGKMVHVAIFPSGTINEPQVILPYDQIKILHNRRKSGIDASSSATSDKKESVPSVGNKPEFTFEEIVSKALNLDTSDIQITFSSKYFHITFEIEGKLVLQPEFTMTEEQGIFFVNLLLQTAAKYTKGKFDANLTQVAQEGRIEMNNLNVDLRMEFIPSGLMDKKMSVTIRILKRESIENGNFDFGKELGYGEDIVKIFNIIPRLRNGLALMSGITGSGKSTVMSRIVATIPPTERTYCIEDPVETKISGYHITQHQLWVPPKDDSGHLPPMGWTEYAMSLKRGAPKVVFFGEMRKDPKLVSAIREMAEAGQLILSTAHFKSAFGVYEALEKVFGIPFDTSVDLLLFVANQVLVRKLCPHCKKKDDTNINFKNLTQAVSDKRIRYAYDTPLNIFLEDYQEGKITTWVKGEGCEHCGGTGFKGRIPVYEYFRPTLNFIEQLLESEKEGRRMTSHQIERAVCEEFDIGKNKLHRYITLIKEGIVDTSPDIMDEIIAP